MSVPEPPPALVSKLDNHERIKVPRNFRPITLDRLLFQHHYPGMPYEPTIAAFINYHLVRDDYSINWDATFLGFCDYRKRMMEQQESGTDTLGYPTDQRKRMALARQQRDEAIAAKKAQLEQWKADNDQ